MGAVAGQASAARETSGEFILHETQTQLEFSSQPGSHEQKSESWQDTTNGRSLSVSYDAKGQRRTESLHWYTGNISHHETVWYQTHSWTTSTHTRHSTPTTAGAEEFSKGILALVKSGQLSVVGSDTVNGTSTLLLNGKIPLPQFPPNTPDAVKAEFPTHQNVWVDPSTWLPVRNVLFNGQDTVVATIDFDWLTRSSANLDLLQVVIPAGFKHIASDSGPSSGSPGSTTLA